MSRSFWEHVTADKAWASICPGGGWEAGNVERDFSGVSLQTVLDFGCGVGRNVGMLRRWFGDRCQLIGFDLPNMIQINEEPLSYSLLTDDFDKIRQCRPFHVWASLTFQHIHADELDMYFWKMNWPHLIYLTTRSWLDEPDRYPLHHILRKWYSPLWISCEDIEADMKQDKEFAYYAVLVPRLVSKAFGNE